MTARVQTGGVAVSNPALDRPPRPRSDNQEEVPTVTSELRQLRRVRWGVRLTLALGISASLAANILHAHHVLIDQVISGWPPVAVFATIEAIARVPIRRRWLAAIRLLGLGFVAAMAFWVSYWHMASVAAEHGENGSKFLLPLSVDGLVVVASISLVELTGQISAVEAAARTVPASAPAVSQPADVSAAVASRDQPVTAAPYDVARAALAPQPDQSGVAVLRRDESDEPGPVAALLPAPLLGAADGAGSAAQDNWPVVEPVAIGSVSTPRADRAAPPDDAAASSDRDARADEGPPENPNEAILWWRAKDPALPVSQIAARVGRSERTVRRILDAAPAALPQPGTPSVGAQSSEPTVGAADTRYPSAGRPVNGAAVEELAESMVSPT